MKNVYVQVLIEAAVIFIGIFLFNYIGFVRKNKKLKKNDMPLELIYLSYIYALEPKYIKFRQFQYIYSFLNAFIITVTYICVVFLVKTMILKVVLGIVLLILLIIICYGILGRYYRYKEDLILEAQKQQKQKKGNSKK